jgi:hypothetical protein
MRERRRKLLAFRRVGRLRKARSALFGATPGKFTHIGVAGKKDIRINTQ